MSNHSQTIVPISTWCYISPELGYKGYSIDVGLMAEALIYYDTVFVNITNQPQFATFIEWFIKQGKYDELLSLISEGVIQFYDYFDNVTLPRTCGKTERMSIKTIYLIPNAGEYRLRESKHLGKSFRDTGSDFRSVSRPRPEIPVNTLWRTCVGN